MVLSNKKLKQKLRAALVESLAKTDGSAPSNQESLKQLLASATKRPVLSKRQKRRKVQSLRSGADNSGEEQEGVAERSEKSSFEEVGGGTSNEREDKRLKKKRKRGEESKSGGLGEEKSGDDLSEKAVKNEEKKKRKKKKKVKKKKKDKSVGAKEKETNEAKDDEKETVTEQGDALTQANRPFLPFAGQETEDVARKVYVGGIPYYSSEDDIRSYFEGCGTITEIDCMTFPESGKFRGIAIIGFKTEAAAKRALAFDGSDMGGFFLTIQPYKATRSNRASNFTPPTVEGYNRIYLGNLSWDITEDDVRKFLSDCNISSIRFGMDKETGEFRGYAHVDFSDSHSMVMAMKLDQQILCGRPAKVTSAILKDSDKSQSRPVATHLAADNKSGELSVISGKIKGRKCYTCNEKGHLFSACPKKPAIPNGNVKSHSTPVTTHIVADNNSGELSVISGKIRGRKCYICNEKGHLSSACPEKPADGLTTPVAT